MRHRRSKSKAYDWTLLGTVLNAGPAFGRIYFTQDDIESAARSAALAYFEPTIANWKNWGDIPKNDWRRVVRAVISSLSESLKHPGSLQKKRGMPARPATRVFLNPTPQTKNRERTEEKSGHRPRRCETRVHADAERRSPATMRAGKRQVKNPVSPKPAALANHQGRNERHERRLRSELITRRNGPSRPSRQAPSPRSKGTPRIQRKPVVRRNRFPLHRPN